MESINNINFTSAILLLLVIPGVAFYLSPAPNTANITQPKHQKKIFLPRNLSLVDNDNDNATTQKDDNDIIIRHDLSCNEQTMNLLRGKNVILTGASSGLGKALAFQLANSQVKTMVLSGRNVEQLEQVKSSCEQIILKQNALKLKMANDEARPTDDDDSQSKSVVKVVTCDLTDEMSVNKFSKEALDICDNKPDILVLCGGISSRSSFLETKFDVDKMLMQVNFLSGASIAKKIIPSMVNTRSSSTDTETSGQGHIIWISSVQDLLGTPFRTSYAASKFAVQGYCEALRSELKSSGVQVSCVSPGYINTNLSKGAITGDGSSHGKMDETTANGADPNDVAVEILDSVVMNGKTDFVVAATLSAKVAIWLKFFSPSLLEKLLVKRFSKAANDKS
mmetsp:Transcript_23246/g.26929  ORF Transcript_23246/g.26929 Transcript_23246/m.26929 type:complete len:394 (+) Transcript_23246:66-1247(+)